MSIREASWRLWVLRVDALVGHQLVEDIRVVLVLGGSLRLVRLDKTAELLEPEKLGA